MNATLAEQLGALDGAMIERLRRRGFDARRLMDWAASIGSGEERNRLRGDVQPFDEAHMAALPVRGSQEHRHLTELGVEALRQGQLAMCVLAGGMATRMGGVVKALVPLFGEHSFLDLRLAERDHLARIYGVAPSLWLMTSEPTEPALRAILGARRDGDMLATFEQLISLRLTPEGGLWRDEQGGPSVHATGHGDLPEALQRSGLLDNFNARGGRYLWISNIDNLGVSVDLALLGHHIASQSEVTVELVDKLPGDRGGGPVMLDGRPVIAELFRLPLAMDPDAIRVFNTNTFLVNSRSLAQLQLEWTYLEVHKEVGGRPAVQFERLIGEMTFGLETGFVRVPRVGPNSRFVPVKTYDDLTEARPAIERIARDRGLT